MAYEVFIPRREIRSISSRGPIVFTSGLILGSEIFRQFQNMAAGEAFLKPQKCFLLWTGEMGWTKCPLIFFILRYIKHYIHINLHIYKKIVPTNFLWVKILDKLGLEKKKIENTMLVGFF